MYGSNYGSNQWNRGPHFYHRPHRPFFLPALLILGLLFWSGAIWWIFKIVLILAIVGFIGKAVAHRAAWACSGYDEYNGYHNGSKHKNDEKAKRGSDPFYNEIEII